MNQKQLDEQIKIKVFLSGYTDTKNWLQKCVYYYIKIIKHLFGFIKHFRIIAQSIIL